MIYGYRQKIWCPLTTAFWMKTIYMSGDSLVHYVANCNALYVADWLQDMFSYAMRHPRKRANPWIKNKENLTAISLCSTLGQAAMFNEIMELSRVVSQLTE